MSLHCLRLPIARLLIVLSLCIASGGHWLALQTLAWAGMLVTYSQQTNITEAVDMTFNGRHPCSLCKQIEQVRRADNEHQVPASIKKFDFNFLLLTEQKSLARFYRNQPWARSAQSAPAFNHPPQVPPPREIDLC